MKAITSLLSFALIVGIGFFAYLFFCPVSMRGAYYLYSYEINTSEGIYRPAPLERSDGKVILVSQGEGFIYLALNDSVSSCTLTLDNEITWEKASLFSTGINIAFVNKPTTIDSISATKEIYPLGTLKVVITTNTQVEWTLIFKY